MSSLIPPLVEAYLVVDQPRQRLTHWAQVLAPLDSSHAPPLAKVIAYYDAANDAAILGLRYDELALGPDRLAYVMEVALLGELGMIQPAELSDGDRKRFIHDRLARCTLQIDNQRSVVGALTELVRLVREARSADVPPRATPLGTVPIQKRALSPPPIPLTVPKGTRDDLRQAAKPARGTRDLEPPAPPRTDLPRADRVEVRVSPNVVRGKGSGSHASLPEPVPESINDAETKLDQSPYTRARRMRSPSQLGTDPYLPPTTTPAPPVPNIIYARYLRSGRWVPIRIGALSLKGAALMTGALPRLHDHVDVALTFGGHRALVRGAVGKVTTERDAKTSGTAAFNVSFELDDASRRQLTSLLTAARAANVTIKPPPPRSARRLPVEWPVGLGTTRGVVRAQALDISHDGMFVRPTTPLVIDASLSFSAVLDDGGAPVAGRAKVVRHVTDGAARAAGLVAGYGLNIVDMGDADRARWGAFVARVERRADRRILIGATPTRLAELTALLAGCGYAVIGGTDPGAVVQLARGESRPVDAAVVDAEFLTPTMSQAWVESLFSERGVPCHTLRGDPRGARVAVDRLLSIG